MLAKALANTVQGTHARIQFTPDLLPTDVTGVTIYDQHKGTFEFHPGPIFATIVLADEINRASPKTQSALLEVMEEGRVTVDGVAHAVGAPFMVIATQNPIEQAGTYRLPEAQLDRFLMKTSLGYPDADGDRGAPGRRRRSATARRWCSRSSPPARSARWRPGRRGLRRPAPCSRYVAASPRRPRATPARAPGPVGPRLPGAGARRQDLGGRRRAATTSCPTTSRSSPSPCSCHRLLLDAEAQFGGDDGRRGDRASCSTTSPPPTDRVA